MRGQPEPPRSDEASPDEVRVRVNGEDRRFPSGTSIAGLLARLEVSTPRVAVERNREIVPKASYDSTHLEDDDRLEVVEFVGGG
jgi:thiamine biosynthesis protein ThiS